MFVLEDENQELYDRISEQNLNRQYELLINCIEIGLTKGSAPFDKYMLWALNHVAVANICQHGGRFRKEPVYVRNHKPPHFDCVPELMDAYIATIQENWFTWGGNRARGIWALAFKLDTSLCRREWAYSASGMLLSAMRSFRQTSSRKKDGPGEDQGKPRWL
jgi:hypothetical protein